MILYGIFDEGFGIDRAGDVAMQVGAFGHFYEPGVKGDRAGAGDFQAALGALFCSALRGRSAELRPWLSLRVGIRAESHRRDKKY